MIIADVLWVARTFSGAEYTLQYGPHVEIIVADQNRADRAWEIGAHLFGIRRAAQPPGSLRILLPGPSL